MRTEVLNAWRNDKMFNVHAHMTILPPIPHLSSTLERMYREQSKVLFVPGWESWSVREIAKYRAREEMGRCNLLVCV